MDNASVIADGAVRRADQRISQIANMDADQLKALGAEVKARKSGVVERLNTLQLITGRQKSVKVVEQVEAANSDEWQAAKAAGLVLSPEQKKRLNLKTGTVEEYTVMGDNNAALSRQATVKEVGQEVFDQVSLTISKHDSRILHGNMIKNELQQIQTAIKKRALDEKVAALEAKKVKSANIYAVGQKMFADLKAQAVQPVITK